MKNTTTLFFLLILVLLTSCDGLFGGGNAQSKGQLVGTVIDAETYDVIAGARIVLSPGNLITYSDSEGYYEFLDLEAKTYQVVATADFYADVDGEVEVLKNTKHDVTIYMQRAVVEDYSSAIVESCHYNIKADILSCRRNGKTVEFNFMLTNTGLGDLRDFRIEGNDGYKTIIFDDLGNSYVNQTLTWGANVSYSGYTLVSSPLLDYVPCKGSVKLTNVPISASYLTIKLQVYAYGAEVLNQRDYISFRNIPIY